MEFQRLKFAAIVLKILSKTVFLEAIYVVLHDQL